MKEQTNGQTAVELNGVQRIHFVGIGGSGMSPLAEILHARGYALSGSDNNESDNLTRIRALGIPVYMGHRAENINGADMVVYTAAVPADNSELAAARAAGLPLIERAALLGWITRQFPHTVAVAGTHGKTTSTAMLCQILLDAGTDPSIFIGGRLPCINANGHAGTNDTMVCEACEFRDHYLEMRPAVSILLDVDADHLDYFGTLDNVIASFRKFCTLAGKVIANGDDPHTVKAMEGIDYVSFGLGEGNRIHAANMCPDWRHFDVVCDGEYYCHLDMGVLGKHNAMNALAAAAAAWMMGIPGEAVSHGLQSFHGAGRRMEFKGTYNGADVYDDYAHHPDEVAATIAAVRNAMPDKRLVLAFQPHTYSRTSALFDDFVRELGRADVLVLAEIYAARERNTIGISSADVAEKIPGAVFCETLPEVTDYLRENVREGDVVITMGAGDIFRAGEALLGK